MSGYRPGVCNIGRRQRRRRLAYALVGFAAAVLYVAVCVVVDAPVALVAGAFVPLAVGFEWGLQAYTSFCVRLALASRYDFRGSGGATGAVDDPGARRADRVQAAKVTAAAVALAAATTGGVVAALL